MQCRLTGSEGTPVDAHIIPRSFYRIDADDSMPYMMLASQVTHYPKRARIGVYDSTIVTEAGERYFEKCDDYAAKVLIDRIGERQAIPNDRSRVGYLIHGVDYGLLKLFFISLLWRASVSQHPMFRRVSLGAKLEQQARRQILDGDPGGPEEFAVVVAGFSDRLDTGFGILDPIRLRLGHLNYYLFYLNHVIAYIKVDSQPTSSPWDAAIMRPNRPLLVIDRGEFRRSKEFPVMRSIAAENKEFIPKWWKTES